MKFCKACPKEIPENKMYCNQQCQNDYLKKIAKLRKNPKFIKQQTDTMDQYRAIKKGSKPI